MDGYLAEKDPILRRMGMTLAIELDHPRRAEIIREGLKSPDARLRNDIEIFARRFGYLK